VTSNPAARRGSTRSCEWRPRVSCPGRALSRGGAHCHLLLPAFLAGTFSRGPGGDGGLAGR
jgi:hypothetical protein